jgi:protein Mpv17
MSSEVLDDHLHMEALPGNGVTAPNESRSGGAINLVLGVLIGLSIYSYLGLLDSPTIWHGWTALEIFNRVPVDLWNFYSKVLEESPILTKACTSATVYTIGDIISQRAEGKTVEELDQSRVLRSLTAGLVGHGPLSHFWYMICDGFFGDVLHWTAWWAVFPKVVVDQLVWGTIWNSTYLMMLGLMKREKVDKILDDTRNSVVPLLLAGLKLWPAVHIVTYGLIPVENRLLWVDFVEIFWVIILASQASGHGVAVMASDVDTETRESAVA